MCLAAAATLASFRTLTSTILGKLFSRRFARWISRGATAVVVIAIVLLSVSRSIALVVNYGAPMRLYAQLPQVSHYTYVMLCKQPSHSNHDHFGCK